VVQSGGNLGSGPRGFRLVSVDRAGRGVPECKNCQIAPFNGKRPAEAGLLVPPDGQGGGEWRCFPTSEPLGVPPVPFVPAFLQVAHE
jgi:hypothetical protein